MKKYYLAYGSNLNYVQMSELCPNAVPLKHTILPSYRLVFKGSVPNQGLLTIEESEMDNVPLTVYEISSQDEKRLDEFEHVPAVYIKRHIGLKINGQLVECFIYTLNKTFKYTMPSDNYFKTCLKGYKDSEFDYSPLYQAMSNTYLAMHSVPPVTKSESKLLKVH